MKEPLDSPYMKRERAIRLSIYGFLLMFNSNILPNKALLRDITVQNMSDLEFDLSKSFKVNLMVQLDSPYIRSY